MRLAPLLCVLLPLAAAAQPGTLDPAFGSGGVAQILTPGAAANDVVHQSDGGLLLVGADGGDAAVFRLLADGTPDLAFGDAGVAKADFGEARDVGTAVTLLSDGGFAISGAQVNEDDDLGAAAVARFDASGQLDATFGTGGVVTLVGFGQSLFATVAEMPDSDLLVGGFASTQDFSQQGVLSARYGPDGTPDSDYGTAGVAFAPLAEGLIVNSGRILPNGTLYLVGGTSPSLFEFDPIIARVLPGGDLDSSFGTDGVAVFDAGQPFSFAFDLALDGSGRLVGAGAAIDLFGGTSEAFAFRLLADGTPDAAFGTDGVVRTQAGSSIAQGAGVAAQADGKVVVVGAAGTETAPDAIVLRFTEAGDLDATFGMGGVSRVALGRPSVATGLTLLPTGEIVGAGGLSAGEGSDGVLAFRLQNDGRPVGAQERPTGEALRLALAGPNPTDGSTALLLVLEVPGSVRVAAYDVRGREVAVLHEGTLGAGPHRIAAAAGSLAPGVYLLRATTSEGTATARLVRR